MCLPEARPFYNSCQEATDKQVRLHPEGCELDRLALCVDTACVQTAGSVAWHFLEGNEDLLAATEETSHFLLVQA